MAGGVKPRRHRITLKNSTPAARSAESDRKIVRASRIARGEAEYFDESEHAPFPDTDDDV
jgi:hypothetical protein